MFIDKTPNSNMASEGKLATQLAASGWTLHVRRGVGLDMSGLGAKDVLWAPGIRHKSLLAAVDQLRRQGCAILTQFNPSKPKSWDLYKSASKVFVVRDDQGAVGLQCMCVLSFAPKEDDEESSLEETLGLV